MTIGYLGHLGLKQETTFGAEATPPEVFGEIKNESISMDNRLIRPVTVNGTRFVKHTYPGPVGAGGGISLDMKPEGITPWLLKGLFGAVSSAQAAEGVYDHSFTPLKSPRLPSFTVQVDHGAGCQNWIGSTVGGARISVAPGGLLEMSADLLAQRPKAATAAAPVYNSIRAWKATNVAFTFNGESRLDFEDFRLEINNDVEPVHTLNGQRWAGSHVARGFEVSGVVNFVFGSDADRRRLWGAADAVTPQLSIDPASLTITITHNQAIADGYYYSLTINLPKVYYSTAPANITSARDRIIQTVAFVASFDSATDKLVDLVLRNSEAGYPDPE